MAKNIKANTALNIRKIMIDKNIKNESDFADLLGISKQTLFNWKKRNTYDIDKIIEVFPDINRVWLLTGEGSMLKEDNQEKSDISKNQRLCQIIESKKQSAQIRNNAHFADLIGVQTGYLSEVLSGKRNLTERFIQKISDAFPEININWLMTGTGKMLKDDIGRNIDRLDTYLKYKGINDNQATELLSLSVGTIGKSRKENRDLSKKTIQAALNKFQDLNPIWLLTGTGSMLKEEYQEKNNNLIETIDLDMQSTILERINKAKDFLIYNKIIKNQQEFADLLGINKGNISSLLKGKRIITDNFIVKISQAFPQIDKNWLLTGEGSMLKEENQEKADTSINQRVIEAIDWLKNNGKIFSNNDFAVKLGKHKSYISDIVNNKRPVTGKFIQDIINQFQELSPAWLLTGEGSMLKGKDKEQKNNNGNIKYYYEMSASAYDLEISDNISEIEEPYNYLTIPGFRGECVAMNVAGNSMSPTAKNKDIVVVDANEVRNIIDGSVYMIIINDGHRMIKRLALDRENNLIKCISDNPDKELYPIFTIESNRIAKIYKVKGFITLTLF